MKRAFDVIASGVGLAVLSPLLAIIAVAVRATDRGPALFRQVRVGRGDTRFTILKFRTMRPHVAGQSVTGHADPRITTVGGFLRRTKLDELPQLVNVLRGDMSLVGPRPEVPELAQYWTAEQASTILSVRPGITDPASVKFKNESEQLAGQADPESYYVESILPIKAGMYVKYIHERTFWGDVKLILRTIGR